MEVAYYHKPISEIFREIQEAGFAIEDFIEPKPLKSLKRVSGDDFSLFEPLPALHGFSRG